MGKSWRLYGCGLVVLCAALLAACSPPSTPTTQSRSSAPTAVAATYTDAANGRPGYALVVNPGPAGSGILGGLAVYQYADGAQTAYFSFYGKATSMAPFSVRLQGDRSAGSATVRVRPSSSSSITIDNCARLFSPVVPNDVPNTVQPPAPGTCTFTYKLAPGPPRTQPAVTTDLTATAATQRGLLTSYLQQNNWQSDYARYISTAPHGTYVAYDPETGLDWAYATFTYDGPVTTAGGTPSVAMQDGGNEAYFYRIPVPGALPSAGGSWVMVESGGLSDCYSLSVVPRSVLQVWGLRDGPVCAQG
jgi:hypothetical protein